jgi:hypothetical protein
MGKKSSLPCAKSGGTESNFSTWLFYKQTLIIYFEVLSHLQECCKNSHYPSTHIPQRSTFCFLCFITFSLSISSYPLSFFFFWTIWRQVAGLIPHNP